MGAEPPDHGLPEGIDFDDAELDQLIADWKVVDRESARVLREALAEHRGAPRSLVAGIAACPEVEPAPGGDLDDDVRFLEVAFSILSVPWRAGRG